MTDPRIQAAIGDTHPPCAGSCAMSRNEHVHFPEGFAPFVDALVTALGDLPPEAEPVDPVDALAERWKSAFTVVWGELKAIGEPDTVVVIKAAEMALAMARGSPIA